MDTRLFLKTVLSLEPITLVMASDSATANYSNTYGEREERTQENDRKKDKSRWCDYSDDISII